MRLTVSDRSFTQRALCYWRKLPQVSFLSRQNTSFVSTKVCLSRQNFFSGQTCFSRHKSFVATSLLLSRQTCVCRDKTCLLSRQKYSCVKTFVATNIILSRQAYFCRDQRTVLSRLTRVRRDKSKLVATKNLLLAAPANDITQRVLNTHRRGYSAVSSLSWLV